MNIESYVDDQLSNLSQYGIVDVDDETPGRRLVTITYLEEDGGASVLQGAQIVANFIQQTHLNVYHMAACNESVSFFLQFEIEIPVNKDVA